MARGKWIFAAAMAVTPGLAAAHSDQGVLSNPWAPKAEFAVTTAAGAFVLVVAPNLVPYDKAQRAAAAASARFCQSLGMAAPSAFRQLSRYSKTVLDGWEFSGSCT